MPKSISWLRNVMMKTSLSRRHTQRASLKLISQKCTYVSIVHHKSKNWRETWHEHQEGGLKQDNDKNWEFGMWGRFIYFVMHLPMVCPTWYIWRPERQRRGNPSYPGNRSRVPDFRGVKAPSAFCFVWEMVEQCSLLWWLSSTRWEWQRVKSSSTYQHPAAVAAYQLACQKLFRFCLLIGPGLVEGCPEANWAAEWFVSSAIVVSR